MKNNTEKKPNYSLFPNVENLTRSKTNRIFESGGLGGVVVGEMDPADKFKKIFNEVIIL